MPDEAIWAAAYDLVPHSQHSLSPQLMFRAHWRAEHSVLFGTFRIILCLAVAIAQPQTT